MAIATLITSGVAETIINGVATTEAHKNAAIAAKEDAEAAVLLASGHATTAEQEADRAEAEADRAALHASLALVSDYGHLHGDPATTLDFGNL
jgi:type IV secretory pathway VirJ component